MQASRDGVKMVRELHGLLASIVAAIGTTWTSRRAEMSRDQKVRFVTLTGRADAYSGFLFQVEQSKSRALYYNARNQLR
jgi:hypothetical protein